MPAPRKIDLLPAAVRAELDKRIVGHGFGNYTELAEWLADQGFEISKTTVAAHGLDMKRHLDAVRTSTQAAIAYEEAAADDTDARSGAIFAHVQKGIFDALLAYAEADNEQDPAKRMSLLAKVGKDFAAASGGVRAGKRFARDVRERLDAAREEVKRIATGAGVSEETMALIDQRLQGVV